MNQRRCSNDNINPQRLTQFLKSFKMLIILLRERNTIDYRLILGGKLDALYLYIALHF